MWLNTNWLVWRGLRQHGRDEVAEEVADSMAALIERSGFREYFNPADGSGNGSDDFSWLAALLTDRLLRDPSRTRTPGAGRRPAAGRQSRVLGWRLAGL